MSILNSEKEIFKDLKNKSVEKLTGSEIGGAEEPRFRKPDLEVGSESEEDDSDYGGLPPPGHNITHLLTSFIAYGPGTDMVDDTEYAFKMINCAEELKANKNCWYQNHPNKNIICTDYLNNTEKSSNGLFETDVLEIIKKTNINAIEKQKSVSMLRYNQLRNVRKMERAKSTGKGWFNMQPTQSTKEVENDLKILQMRSVLNPKQFYKKNDLKVLPKYFQSGTLQHSPLDYFKERDVSRNKKKALVDDLLADAVFQKFTKRKYKELTARTDKYVNKKKKKKS